MYHMKLQKSSPGFSLTVVSSLYHIQTLSQISPLQIVVGDSPHTVLFVTKFTLGYSVLERVYCM